jgi:tungstate transport system substrate-binding protein
VTIRAPMLLISLGLLCLAACKPAETEFITLACTTSTENSGLLDRIFPLFEEKTGIRVHTVAVGTGQALRLARSGDADVILVHDRVSEDAFVSEGHGVRRYDVMYNDFVLLGPASDPAGVGGETEVVRALSRIAETRSLFISRGDDSGTHKAELRLWRAAELDPSSASGTWYRETGSGMGSTLNHASAAGGYTLADRGTWLSFRNRGELEILVEGDPPLYNPYGVILVDPARHPHVKAEAGQRLIDWLISVEGQAAIAGYRVQGEMLFKPNAGGATAGAGPEL